MTTQDQTTASVEQADSPISIPFLGTGMGAVSSGLALVLGSAYAIQTVVRRLSRDKVELVKDRAESDIVLVLQTQLTSALDRADKAEKERNASAESLGKFSSEVESQRRELTGLKEIVAVLNEKLDRQNALLQSVLEENRKILVENAKLDAHASALEMVLASLRGSPSPVPEPVKQ